MVCALIAGFYQASLQGDSLFTVILKGILYAILVVGAYCVLAVGLLFVGCLVMA